MPITVSSTPTITDHLESDESIVMSLGGSGYSAPYDKPYWESSSGTFSDYLLESPTFQPLHRTQTATILGKRVARMYNTLENNWDNSTNVALINTDNGTVTKNAGVNGSWDAKAVSAIFSPDLNCFFSFKAGDNIRDKAGGLTDNGTEMNPTQSGFRFAWFLREDGLAVPYHVGNALANPRAYTTSTVFKLQKVGSTMNYYMDNELVANVAVGGTFNYYPILTFQDSSASIVSAMFQREDGTNYVDDLVFDIVAVFPGSPDWGFDLTKDNVTLVSVGEDQSEVVRKKGNAKKVIGLSFNERPFTEYSEINDFWDWHEKHREFIYKDLALENTYRVRFTSGIRIQPVGADRITMSFTIREV